MNAVNVNETKKVSSRRTTMNPTPRSMVKDGAASVVVAPGLEPDPEIGGAPWLFQSIKHKHRKAEE